MKAFTIILAVFICSIANAGNFKPMMIYDSMMLLDKSWNEAIHNGILRFEKATGTDVAEKSITDISTFSKMATQYAKENYNPIMINNLYEDKEKVIKKIMLTYPNVRFIVFNGTVNMPNAHYFIFSYQESSFLAGYLAAKKSKTKKLGFIGGMDIPLIRNYLCGYIKGAKYADESADVQYQFISDNYTGWANPDKAYQIALSQIDSGTDVIFAPSGGSSQGALKAANDKKVYAIGVDSNQNYMYPGTVLTSVIVKVDNAAYSALTAAQKDLWGDRMMIMGLQKNGVDITFDKYNEPLISEDLRKTLDFLKTDIILKKIELPDYSFQKECRVGGKVLF